MMSREQVLKEKADAFRTLLEKYAERDPDVEDFLQRMHPWFDKIDRGEVRSPCDEYTLFIYFTNPDLSPLAEKYTYSQSNHELSQASAEFSQAMRGWS